MSAARCHNGPTVERRQRRISSLSSHCSRCVPPTTPLITPHTGRLEPGDRGPYLHVGHSFIVRSATMASFWQAIGKWPAAPCRARRAQTSVLAELKPTTLHFIILHHLQQGDGSSTIFQLHISSNFVFTSGAAYLFDAG